MNPQAAIIAGGRLHLQHGPIDLVIGAEGARDRAFDAARAAFDGVLEALVAELAVLRSPLADQRCAECAPYGGLTGPVARRMAGAVAPHDAFVTPMAAVAGAVADHVLAAMRAATGGDLRRAYVNNGGDIALHLAPGARFTLAMAGLHGAALGRIAISAGDGIGGIATSGQGGRSLSFGVAESVTVLARDAASADAAATLIANAVDLPGHPAITRRPAAELRPDSDLGDRVVVVACGDLRRDEVARALERGAERAQAMRRAGLIAGAALFLRGQARIVGETGFDRVETEREALNA